MSIIISNHNRQKIQAYELGALGATINFNYGKIMGARIKLIKDALDVQELTYPITYRDKHGKHTTQQKEYVILTEAGERRYFFSRPLCVLSLPVQPKKNEDMLVVSPHSTRMGKRHVVFDDYQINPLYHTPLSKIKSVIPIFTWHDSSKTIRLEVSPFRDDLSCSAFYETMNEQAKARHLSKVERPEREIYERRLAIAKFGAKKRMEQETQSPHHEIDHKSAMLTKELLTIDTDEAEFDTRLAEFNKLLAKSNQSPILPSDVFTCDRSISFIYYNRLAVQFHEEQEVQPQRDEESVDFVPCPKTKCLIQ